MASLGRNGTEPEVKESGDDVGDETGKDRNIGFKESRRNVIKEATAKFH